MKKIRLIMCLMVFVSIISSVSVSFADSKKEKLINDYQIELINEYGIEAPNVSTKVLVDDKIINTKKDVELNWDFLDFDIEQARSDKNHELLLPENFKKSFGEKGTILVYGSPMEFDSETKRHRYLGYDLYANSMTNPYFRDDFKSNSHKPTYNASNIILAPWTSKELAIKGLTDPNTLNSSIIDNNKIGIIHKFRLAVLDGIEKFYGTNKIDILNMGVEYEWEKSMLIHQLPTYNRIGIGRMWRTGKIGSDGKPSIYYLTITISPYKFVPLDEDKRIVAEVDGNIAEYLLDYDVLSKQMKYQPMNIPSVAEIVKPYNSKFFKYEWISNTFGGLYLNVIDHENILSNLNKNGFGDLSGNEVYNTRVERSPYLSWTTYKKSFEDDVLGGQYLENNTNKIKKFAISKMSGSINRYYQLSIFEETVKNGVRAGSWKPINSSNLSNSIISSDFSPISKAAELSVQSKNYNGIPLKLQAFYQGTEGTLSNLQKQIAWESTRYDVPVQRYLRNLDLSDNTISLSVANGKYKRTFQTIDRASVDYDTNISLKDHFDIDRRSAYLNPANVKKYQFKYAPFATDEELQGLPYPLKAGYYYVPHSEYTATVKTVIHKREGETTEHKRIVDSVINSFRVFKNMLLVDKNNHFVNEIKVEHKTKYRLISKERLIYKSGPTNINEYLYGDENILLGNTNINYKRILEGWSSTFDANARESYNNFRYREYVKDENINRFEEETLITFIVNPNYKDINSRLYTHKDTRDGNYNIIATFSEFNNGVVSKPISSSSHIDIDEIGLNIRGVMNDDLYTGE